MAVRRLKFSLKHLLAIQAAFAVALWLVLSYLSSGKIIEQLNSPLQIAGWSDGGLKLADGRNVALPGIKELPSRSIVLSEATKRGVEVANDGRVYGLIRVH
ncbi:MAG TPA: hypothetical protein VKH44_07925, partial [Pirellulaceae bacterium]|nr:hypothetical protein [Pirellulaceae bacterium]